MSMIVLHVWARFTQPGDCVIMETSWCHQVEKTGDSELLYAPSFDSQSHSRMPQMGPFPTCAGMRGIVQHQCEDGLAAPTNVSGDAYLEEGVGVANEVVKSGVAFVPLRAPCVFRPVSRPDVQLVEIGQ